MTVSGLASRPCALALLALTLLPAAAARGSDRTLTLVEALEAARADAPVLRAAGHAGEASRQALEAARAARLGRVDGVVSATRHQDDVIVRPMSRDLVLQGFEGLPFDRDQLVAGLAFSVPVFTSGRLAAGIDAATAEARRAARGREATEDEVLASVRVLYVGAQVQAAQRTAVDARIRALVSREEDLQLAVEVGRAAIVELRRVQASLAEARSARARLTARYDGSVAELLALMGRSPDTGGGVALEAPPERLPELRREHERLVELLGDSPTVRSAAAAEDVGLARARGARAERLPRVSVAGSWMSHWAPSVDGRLETWQVGVEVAVPLFDGGARRARQAEAELRAAELGARADETRLRARAALRGALARWDAATARVSAARARLEARREVESVEAVRWETGAGTLQDLLDAEADRLAAESELIAARGDVRVAAAEINRIAGSEVAW